MEDILLVAITILLFIIANKLTNGRCWQVTKSIASAVFWGTVILGSAGWYINSVGWVMFLKECFWGMLIAIGLFLIWFYGNKLEDWLRKPDQKEPDVEWLSSRIKEKQE
jgi:hypothetical protein